MFEARISAGATEKLLESEAIGANVVSWSCDMENMRRNALNSFANRQTKRLSKCFRPPCLEGTKFKKEELETVGE